MTRNRREWERVQDRPFICPCHESVEGPEPPKRLRLLSVSWIEVVYYTSHTSDFISAAEKTNFSPSGLTLAVAISSGVTKTLCGAPRPVGFTGIDSSCCERRRISNLRPATIRRDCTSSRRGVSPNCRLVKLPRGRVERSRQRRQTLRVPISSQLCGEGGNVGHKEVPVTHPRKMMLEELQRRTCPSLPPNATYGPWRSSLSSTSAHLASWGQNRSDGTRHLCLPTGNRMPIRLSSLFVEYPKSPQSAYCRQHERIPNASLFHAKPGKLPSTRRIESTAARPPPHPGVSHLPRCFRYGPRRSGTYARCQGMHSDWRGPLF